MKKKIKDLTINDLMNECDDNCRCETCPFSDVLCGEKRFSLITDLKEKELEKEVEIDESDNDKH